MSNIEIAQELYKLANFKSIEEVIDSYTFFKQGLGSGYRVQEEALFLTKELLLESKRKGRNQILEQYQKIKSNY